MIIPWIMRFWKLKIVKGRKKFMLKIVEKFRGLIALLAVVLTVFGTLMAMVEYGSFVMLVGVFLLVFAELCEISVKLNK